MERRGFLKAGTAGLASLVTGAGMISWTPRAEAATISRTFYITAGTQTMPDGASVYVKGYSDSAADLNIPASHIICQEGDTLSITVINRLAVTHNFVIGGLKAGDPPLASSGDIAPGGSKTVTLTVPVGSAGSYLFYDNKTSYNRFLGLHGGLAIMPAGKSDELYPGSPKFKPNRQQFWIFNDIDPALNRAVQQGTTIPSTFTPLYFTINGLTSRPPGAPGHGDPARDALYDPRSQLSGVIGDRTLVRMLNPGMCAHAMHVHANHVEWLTDRGSVRPQVWKKDTIYVRNNLGKADVIFPFEAPPDAYPPVTKGHYPMHLHDEMSQTAGGGLYQFGAMTEIVFK